MPTKGKTTKAEPKPMSAVTVDIPEEGDTYPAQITSVEIVAAKEIFKDKAKDPERPTIKMGFEGPGGVKGNANLSAPGITPDGRVVARNPKSNLFKYVRKYGKGPFIGQKCEVAIDKDGFYRLVIE